MFSSVSAFVAGALADPTVHRPISPPVDGPIPAGLTFTENGQAAVSVAGLNNNLLALFDKLVRDLDDEKLVSSMKSVLTDAWTSENPKESIIDLFLLAFQTRWSRGGKAEKLLFYKMIHVLYCFYPSVVVGLLDMIPAYGYWKDPLLLIKECESNLIFAGDADKVQLLPLKSKVWTMYAVQLKLDLVELELANKEKRSPTLTFAAKFAPSEKKEFDNLFSAVNKISKIMYPQMPPLAAKKAYRKDLARLRVALAIPEVMECSNAFAEIDFNRVTSLCLSRKTKAYLNESLKGFDDSENGNRFPDSEDRVTCRNNLLKTLAEKGVKGKDLFPHELVSKVQSSGRSSTAVDLVINGQWKAVREGVETMVEERKKSLAEAQLGDGGAKPSVDFGKLIVMADVSGSMYGTPMEVAIAMGILVSEVCHPAFRDLVLTFHESPVFHDLSGCTSFTSKVKSLQSAPWGCSTNFKKAMELVLKIVEEKRLPQEEIPDLMVVSDMQFDQASREKNMFQVCEKMFKDLGMKLYGKALQPPNIIFWNVRAAEGFPAAADQKGCMLLSGYSASLMKFVLSGEMAAVEDIVVDEETGMVDIVKGQITPEEALRKILLDEGLLPVRELLENKFADEIGMIGGEKREDDEAKLEDLMGCKKARKDDGTR